MLKQFPVTVDFETVGIEARPVYPPAPVGVSIKYHGQPAKYLSWGHTSNNNCGWAEARAALQKAWKHRGGLLFQNGKFDLDVAEVHMGLPLPDWQKVHDTLFLIFLEDPNQIELGLKPAAERFLGLPPDEQNEVADWLIENQPIPDVKISRSKSSDHYFGKYIAFAPAELVGKYADGDTERTEKLFEHLYPRVAVERKMLGAYNRERELSMILLQMERQGIRIDLKRLKKDVKLYSTWCETLETWIIHTIKAPADINLNSGAQLIEAMVAAGKVDTDLMPVTATGKWQTNKEALLLGVSDKTLLAVLKYRTQLRTCLNTFMMPWLETALHSGGYIFTTWNQTKSSEGAGAIGTRTGRLSSTPNFQNIPKEFPPFWQHEDKNLPKCPFDGLPPLPVVRSYVIPYKDNHVLIDRDYSQQEPRILAHFDGAALMDKYNADPWVDFHDYAKAELAKAGKFYDRKPVKNTNLGLIYGMGSAKLAIKNDMSVKEAADLKAAILLLYPGLKDMYKDMKLRYRNSEPVRTWGGREYYCEPPRMIDNRIQHFDYKMVNTLIQGSAGDCTKEAIIRYWRVKNDDEKLILNVHDQLTVSVPRSSIVKSMEKLRVAMESVEFDVPILSEGSWSDLNWAELVDYDKKGVKLYGKH